MKTLNDVQVSKIIMEIVDTMHLLEREQLSFSVETYNRLYHKAITTGIHAIVILYGRLVETVTISEDDVVLMLVPFPSNTIGKQLALLIAPQTDVHDKHGVNIEITVAVQLIKNMGMIVSEKNVYRLHV